MGDFHRTTCACDVGMSKACHGGQLFEADFPEGELSWTCPHCGGAGLRRANKDEIDSWRAHLEAQAELRSGRERPRREP